MENPKVTANEQEAQLIEALRSKPELFDLVSEVVEVYQSDPKQFKDLHTIETCLLGKVKAIDNNVLALWAESLEKEVSGIEKSRKGVRKHSKKNLISLSC